ncbi:hypothetical protein [Levilactobacillus brevis]|nr:hypothetical protein [Levilactobacillus brevis]
MKKIILDCDPGHDDALAMSPIREIYGESYRSIMTDGIFLQV